MLKTFIIFITFLINTQLSFGNFIAINSIDTIGLYQERAVTEETTGINIKKANQEGITKKAFLTAAYDNVRLNGKDSSYKDQKEINLGVVNGIETTQKDQETTDKMNGLTNYTPEEVQATAQKTVDDANANNADGHDGEVILSQDKAQSKGSAYYDKDTGESKINVNTANTDLANSGEVINVLYHEGTNHETHKDNEKTAKRRGDYAQKVWDYNNAANGNVNTNTRTSADWNNEHTASNNKVLRNGNKSVRNANDKANYGGVIVASGAACAKNSTCRNGVIKGAKKAIDVAKALVTGEKITETLNQEEAPKEEAVENKEEDKKQETRIITTGGGNNDNQDPDDKETNKKKRRNSLDIVNDFMRDSDAGNKRNAIDLDLGDGEIIKGKQHEKKGPKGARMYEGVSKKKQQEVIKKFTEGATKKKEHTKQGEPIDVYTHSDGTKIKIRRVSTSNPGNLNIDIMKPNPNRANKYIKYEIKFTD